MLVRQYEFLEGPLPRVPLSVTYTHQDRKSNIYMLHLSVQTLHAIILLSRSAVSQLKTHPNAHKQVHRPEDTQSDTAYNVHPHVEVKRSCRSAAAGGWRLTVFMGRTIRSPLSVHATVITHIPWHVCVYRVEYTTITRPKTHARNVQGEPWVRLVHGVTARDHHA